MHILFAYNICILNMHVIYANLICIFNMQILTFGPYDYDS